jgi:transposase
MSRSKIPNFSPEFRLETAKLVVDNGYTYKGAAKAMGVCYSNISKWVMLLNEERSRSNPKTESMTVDLIEIRELKKII